MTAQTATQGGLFGLHAQTALHPGSGAALGTVDLPVQRERHTHWPNIAGSALKGILRDACREQIKADHQKDEKQSQRDKADADRRLTDLFGPPAGQSSEHAGAVSITDARLLAYPVRSLRGVFAWVTCPAVLERLQRDLALVGIAPPEVPAGPEGKNQVLASADCPCLVTGANGKALVLEENELTVGTGDPKKLAGWLAIHLLPTGTVYDKTRERFQKQLVVARDDDFTYFVRYATEITARIGLNYDTKTVKEGALFYQEFLPAETLFYSVVLVNAARTRNGARSAGDLVKALSEMLQKVPVLQVGGDETTGKGYCWTRFNAKEVKS